MVRTPEVLALVPTTPEFTTLLSGLAHRRVCVVSARNLRRSVLRYKDASVLVCDADGIEWRSTLELVQSLAPRIRVIFITRTADERLWLDMLDAGAYDLIPKPCKSTDLCYIIEAAVKSSTAAFVSAASGG